MVSYYFPPLVGIASERAASRAESMDRLGWDVRVVTVRDGHYHRVDEPREFGFPVIRTRSLELSRIVRAAYARAAGDGRPGQTGPEDGAVRPLRTGSLGARLRRWVREWTYIPDAQVGWIPFAAVGSVRAVLDGRRGAVILSTSVPYSAHLAAWLAAGVTRSLWVAEFRDPWSTAHESRLPRSAIRRRLDRALERAIVKRADHVVVTSESTRNGMLAAHGGLTPERITVVMNGFVPVPDARRPDPDEPCEFLYAGTVDPGERPDVILDAFSRLEAKAPGTFLLRILGPEEPWRSAGDEPPAWIRFEGVVTAAAAREAMVRGSALLLLQGHPAYGQILRGKAFEYIGARRPILAVLPPEAEMAQILRDHADVRVVAAYDVEQIAAELERLVEEHRAGALAEPRVPEERTLSLTRDAQARTLDEILGRIRSSPEGVS